MQQEPLERMPQATRQEAERMLEAFQSVGAVCFDLTLTTLCGEKVRFERSISSRNLLARVPTLLQEAVRHQHNVIVRPHAPPPVFLAQLDDLDEAQRARISPYSFLCISTSPGNFQAWIALSEAEESLIRGVRRAVGADPTASGAVRVGGSRNFKAKYAPDFPEIKLVRVASGCITTRAALKAARLIIAEETKSKLPVRPTDSGYRGRFPDYRKCLAGAPFTHGGKEPDRSRADFTFCLVAIDWGFGVEETATRLMEVSSKAQENGVRYAYRTAERAEEAIQRRGKA